MSLYLFRHSGCVYRLLEAMSGFSQRLAVYTLFSISLVYCSAVTRWQIFFDCSFLFPIAKIRARFGGVREGDNCAVAEWNIENSRFLIFASIFLEFCLKHWVVLMTIDLYCVILYFCNLFL